MLQSLPLCLIKKTVMRKLPEVLLRAFPFFLLACSLGASSLIEHYPFSPPNYQTAYRSLETTTNKHDLEASRFTLKGVSKFGANYYFSIYDNQTKKSKWIEAGSPYNGFTILRYDPLKKRIHFHWKENLHTIQIANADEAPMKLAHLNFNKKTDASLEKMGHSALLSNEVRNNERLVANRDNIHYKATKQSDDPANGQVIFFTPQREKVESPRSVRWGRDSNLFAATDIPASAIQIEEKPEVPQQRFKVKRKNTVHNPSGKKPQHLSFAQWQTLNSQ
jgi:hypothetical protein